MITSASSIRAVREWIPVDTPPTPTGYESPREARDAGWLGQVPPPSPPSEPEPPRAPVTYANPHLAPDPWHADPVIPGTDPTLFG
jgi:hypothetical protein